MNCEYAVLIFETTNDVEQTIAINEYARDGWTVQSITMMPGALIDLNAGIREEICKTHVLFSRRVEPARTPRPFHTPAPVALRAGG